MESGMASIERTTTIEGQDAQKRYNLIVHNAREHLGQTALVENRAWTQKDVEKARAFLVASAPFAHPKVNPGYWEHITLASLYAYKLAEHTDLQELNPYEAQTLLLLHDVGRLISPHRYLRNDLVAHRLMQKVGTHPKTLEKLEPMRGLLGLPGQNPVNALEDLTVSQRIIMIADNLGKKDKDGNLFDIKTMKSYDMAQPTRYTAGVWPSENAGKERLVAGRQRIATDLLLAQIDWIIQEYSVDFNKLREEVAEEFNRPQNQKFLLALKDEQETLDINTDKQFSRPPVEVIIFDVGDVLLTGNDGETVDNELIRRMCKFFGCTEDIITHAFEELHSEGMTGAISERGYLEKFWELAGKKPPGDIDTESLREPFAQPDIYHPDKKMQEIIAALANNPNLKLFLFSNAIAAVTPIAENALRKHYPQFKKGSYFPSNRIGVAKGIDNAAAFSWLLHNIPASTPEAVVFIDDNEKYTSAARALFGIRGFTFRGNPYKNLSATERLRRELQKARFIP